MSYNCFMGWKVWMLILLIGKDLIEFFLEWCMVSLLIVCYLYFLRVLDFGFDWVL